MLQPRTAALPVMMALAALLTTTASGPATASKPAAAAKPATVSLPVAASCDSQKCCSTWSGGCGYCLTCRFAGSGRRCETSSFGITEPKGYACEECTYSGTGIRLCSLQGTCPC